MKCTMCGNTVHQENTFQTFMPRPGQPMAPKTVCGQCFVLVSILDTLRRIEHGRPRQPGIQEPDRDVGG